MPGPTPLQVGTTYHIYNRGNNGENIFRMDSDYRIFLQQYRRHIEPVCETFAYCLMPNHFHMLVRVRDPEPDARVARRGASQAFANLFAAYTKTVNHMLDRTGSLFEQPFHRKGVGDDAYFARLVVYIHLNPQRHGFVDDFRDWPWSSLAALLGSGMTLLERATVLGRFGGAENLAKAHREVVNETLGVDDF